MENWDCLEQLLAQGQFEIIDFNEMTRKKDHTDCRVIYLMNDAVESFLVFRNVRYTGTYLEEYEGELGYAIDRESGVLRVDQGESHLLLFFEKLELESHFYNYGGLGHFWVKGNEDLRNLEYQIAIIRDKYDYLGEWACNPLERKLAMLKEFPPLNYASYPSAPLKYVVPMDDPWNVREEALDFMESICKEVRDPQMRRLLYKYSKNPSRRMTKKIAGKLAESRHSAVTEYLYQLIKEAAGEYPKRIYDQETEERLRDKLAEAEAVKREYEGKGIIVRIYREEPFVCANDETTLKLYVMTLKRGIWCRKTKVLEM